MKNVYGLFSLSVCLLGCKVTTSEESSTDITTSSSTTEMDITSEEPKVDTDSTEAIGEHSFVLRIDQSLPPPVVLEMDREKALEVFGEAAKEIRLLDVDSSKLLDNVLIKIQDSCGDQWRKNKSNPEPNCTVTELGQTYGVDWKHSPQYRMVALLTMTPANANMSGTSLSDFQQLFVKNQNVLADYFPVILASSLFCEGTPAEQDACASDPPSEFLTRPFIPVSVLRDTLKQTLLASHPNIGNTQGKLPISLYDALMNMQTLSEKFGPVNGHPGLLMPDDADFTTYSNALTSEFKMTATAESNLRRVHGVDASEGAGEMFINITDVPLAFDFMNENKVKITGIDPNPTVDMRMVLTEMPTHIPACESGLANCGSNLPDMPVGLQYIWSQPFWSFEYIVATAAYKAYHSRVFSYCFFKLNDVCLADVSIGANATPAGWSVFTLKVDKDANFTTPEPQYLWELLLSISQLAVHDFECLDSEDYDNDEDVNETIACAGPNDLNPFNDPDLEIEEGAMQPVFALKGVRIGLTAEEMIAQIRPTLQSQANAIAEIILGTYWKENDHLDFYYRQPEDDGSPYLFFVAPSDKRPNGKEPNQLASYSYSKPGFFADSELSQKVSAKVIEGVKDTEHEKYRLPEGESTLYIQDDTSSIYKLNFVVPVEQTSSEINVRVTKI